MSNASQMTLEEKIVQTLKDDTLMKLVGDEDAITKLVTRAINEALFKDRLEPNGRSWGDPIKVPSPAMAAAQDACKRAADKVVDGIVAGLVDNAEFRELVVKAFSAAMPLAIEQRIMTAITSSWQNAKNDALMAVQEHLQKQGRTL